MLMKSFGDIFKEVSKKLENNLIERLNVVDYGRQIWHPYLHKCALQKATPIYSFLTYLLHTGSFTLSFPSLSPCGHFCGFHL